MRKQFLLPPIVATGVLGLFGLASVGSVAQAGTPAPAVPQLCLPTPSLPPLPVPTPTATPCPPPPPPPPPPTQPVPVPQLPTLPALLPTQNPGNGTGTNNPNPNQPVLPGGPVDGSQPPPPGGPPPGGAPPASIGGIGSLPGGLNYAAVASRFSNSPFVDQLLNILAHPISSQQPDLLHFRPSTTSHPTTGSSALSRAAGALADAFRGRGGIPGRLAVALVVGLLGALVVTSRTAGGRLATAGLGRLSGLRRRHPSFRLGRGAPSWRRRLLAVALLGAVPVAAIAVGVGVATRHSASPATSRGVARAATSTQHSTTGSSAPAEQAGNAALPGQGALHALPAAPAADPASAVEWAQLLTIERGISAQQDQIAAQEAAITRLTKVATTQRQQDDPASAPSAAQSAIDDQLATLVRAHDASSAAYSQSLKGEYAFYRSAAQDPKKQATLAAAAAATPTPEVEKAVDYNFNVVQTQIAQEKSISDAEAKLAALGGPSLNLQVVAPPATPFLAPEVGAIAQPFGPTSFSLEPPINFHGAFFPHFHTGLDIDAPLDTPLHATADGVVVLATQSLDSQGHLVGYGNYVVIAHQGGFLSLYGHLDHLLVKEGQQVHQGDPIGLEGSTGWSTGPHVHFEIRHGNDLLDPAPYVASTLPGAYSQKF